MRKNARRRNQHIEAERKRRHGLRNVTVRGSGFCVKHSSPRRIKGRAPLVRWGQVVERPAKENPPSLRPNCVPVVTRMSPDYKIKIDKQMNASKAEKEQQAHERNKARWIRTYEESQRRKSPKSRARPQSAPPVHRVVVSARRHPQRYRTVKDREQSASRPAWTTFKDGYTPLAVNAVRSKTGMQRPESARVRRKYHPEIEPEMRASTKHERIHKQIQSRTSAQRDSIRQADKEIRACQREVRAAFSVIMMRSSAKNHSRLDKMSSRLDSRRRSSTSASKKKQSKPIFTPSIPTVTVLHRDDLIDQQFLFSQDSS